MVEAFSAAAAAAAGAMPLAQARSLAVLPTVSHGFSSRGGGSSRSPYAACNVGDHVGDEPAAVARNRAGVLARLGRTASRWVSAQQVHGNQVAQVDASSGEKIVADALVTRDPTVTLAVLVADCVPILLSTADGRAVATAHAGWRGTVADVAARTARSLVELAGQSIGQSSGQPVVHAALGPAIGPCCFVVGEPVMEKLQHYAQAVNAPSRSLRRTAAGWHANLWALNVAALRASGVRLGQVSCLAVCTACSPSYFSYRRAGGVTGRQAGVIGLGGTLPVSCGAAAGP